MRTARGLFRAAAVACAVLVSSVSFADLTIDFDQVGSDVVATIGGSFDYSSAVFIESGSSNFASFVSANDGLFGYSNMTGAQEWKNWRIVEQAPYTTPFFGDGSNAGNIPWLATSKTGTAGTFQILANPNSTPLDSEARIRLPLTYFPGDPITGTETWANKTYADLGLATSGTWVWRSPESGAYVTLRINAVPEPAVCAGAVIAAVTLAAWLRRRSATA